MVANESVDYFVLSALSPLSLARKPNDISTYGFIPRSKSDIALELSSIKHERSIQEAFFALLLSCATNNVIACLNVCLSLSFSSALSLSLFLSSYGSVNVQERILFSSFLLRIRQKLSQFVFVFVGKYVQFRN